MANNNKKETEVTASELTSSSSKETASTTVVVDQIETPAEIAEKEQTAARKIIDRVVIFESDINVAETALNVKKVYVGCLLLISKRLANSNEPADETKADDKVKDSLFDKMIDAKTISRATAYRRIGDANAFIEGGLITNDMLAEIEKSEVATPAMTSLLDKKLNTRKGKELQRKRGLLRIPDSDKPVKQLKTAKEVLAEKKKRVESILEEIRKVLKSEEFENECADAREMEVYRTGFNQMEIGAQTFGSRKLLKNKSSEKTGEELVEQSLASLPGKRITVGGE